uniref:Uncharacterized protein n=1 Tax=Arundo donax TaxID=35708 RepID=A0A0A9FN94_ARUDO
MKAPPRNLTTARGRRPRGGGKMRQECSRRYGLPLGDAGLGLGAPSTASKPSGPSDARQERSLEGLAQWAGRPARTSGRGCV